jgi:CubicO group peptidase (beta-lactamase class C family)
MVKNLSWPVFLGLSIILLANPVFAQGAGLGADDSNRGSGMSNAAGGGPAGAGGSGQADQSRTQTIYEMAYQTLAAEMVPGYAIAIVKDGSPVFRFTFGMADIEAKKKVSKNTIFGLASLTKTFTGLALMRLMDEGKIKPSDTLDKYLKDIPPSWQKLTIFQLASMRAGLRESREDELPWPEEMAELKKEPLKYQPGTASEYSNPSFRILGNVIESITGMPYLDYISKEILAPLGMTSTGTTDTLAGTGRVSCQYVAPNGGPPHAIKPKDPMTSYSAGMLASSLEDMCTYAGALLGQKLLSPAAYKEYWLDRPPLSDGKPNNWAWGWGSNINKKLNVRVISMNGGLAGVASTLLLVPDQNMAVVALSNMRTKPVYAIAKRAMNIYLSGVDSGPPPQGGADDK